MAGHITIVKNYTIVESEGPLLPVKPASRSNKTCNMPHERCTVESFWVGDIRFNSCGSWVQSLGFRHGGKNIADEAVTASWSLANVPTPPKASSCAKRWLSKKAELISVQR